MREIDIRVWYKGINRMIYAYGTDEQGKREYYPVVIDVGFSHYQVEDLVIMQYTCQKDIKGIKIYEDDIVYAKDYWGDSGKVYWNEKQLQWWIERFSGGDEPLRSPFADGKFVFEVIGNIWEDPRKQGV